MPTAWRCGHWEIERNKGPVPLYGAKVWLNGEVVYSNNLDRGQIADQDMVPIRLRKGANVLVVKVTQGGGGWSARMDSR